MPYIILAAVAGLVWLAANSRLAHGPTYVIDWGDSPRAVAAVYAGDAERWPELGVANPDALGWATAEGRVWAGAYWTCFRNSPTGLPNGTAIVLPVAWGAGGPDERVPSVGPMERGPEDYIPEGI